MSFSSPFSVWLHQVCPWPGAFSGLRSPLTNEGQQESREPSWVPHCPRAGRSGTWRKSHSALLPGPSWCSSPTYNVAAAWKSAGKPSRSGPAVAALTRSAPALTSWTLCARHWADRKVGLCSPQSCGGRAQRCSLKAHGLKRVPFLYR